MAITTDTVLAETGNQVYAKSYIEGAMYVNDRLLCHAKSKLTGLQ